MIVSRSSQACAAPRLQGSTAVDVGLRIHSATAASEPSCACATNLQQVESAWRLVYDRY